MDMSKGFLKFKRQDVAHRSVKDRLSDFNELDLPLTPDEIHDQAGRCQDCGIPFCHGAGCPLGNNIPDFNELVYLGRWEQACQMLHLTNNFPEVTGRVCPAPCETSCTLAVNDEPVTIRHIEYQIVERGFNEGWIRPLPAPMKTGNRIAVIGSGPAGLAAAQQLARGGHDVVVFEKDKKIGGLLRYGIPDFKLEKKILDRRIQQLIDEGVDFQTEIEVGVDVSAHYLKKRFDCICLTMGSNKPRDLKVPGRELGNVMFAMDYLTAQNRVNSGEIKDASSLVSANGKSVVVVGGGDTGSDCVGTARRQGAGEVYQLEILPKPPENCPDDTPWPMGPRVMRTSTSQEEGCKRKWSVCTKDLIGDAKDNVRELNGCQVEWVKEYGNWKMAEVAGSEFTLKADLVLLALGFEHVVSEGLVESLDLKLDGRGNVEVNDFQTSEAWVFAAGDTASGASLVVRAIDSGRKAAAAIDQWLKV